MPSRVISIFLAFALLLIGFAPREQAAWSAVANAEQAQTQESGESPQRVHEGSSEDPSRDGHTAQWEVQGETAMDLTGLLASRNATLPALALGWPRPQVATLWLAPDLAGPQRPPCAIRSIA